MVFGIVAGKLLANAEGLLLKSFERLIQMLLPQQYTADLLLADRPIPLQFRVARIIPRQLFADRLRGAVLGARRIQLQLIGEDLADEVVADRELPQPLGVRRVVIVIDECLQYVAPASPYPTAVPNSR